MINMSEYRQFLPRHVAFGFTLVELLVAMVLVAILITAGVPGLNGLLSNMEARGSADKLAGAIAFARQEAVSRVTPVTICARDGNLCSNSGADWDNGWLIFLDDDASLCDVAGKDRLRVEDLTSVRSTLASVGAACLTYDGFGENMGNALTITSTTPDGTVLRSIAISAIGGISIQ